MVTGACTVSRETRAFGRANWRNIENIRRHAAHLETGRQFRTWGVRPLWAGSVVTAHGLGQLWGQLYMMSCSFLLHFNVLLDLFGSPPPNQFLQRHEARRQRAFSLALIPNKRHDGRSMDNLRDNLKIRDWKAALTRFTIQFEERIPQL